MPRLEANLALDSHHVLWIWIGSILFLLSKLVYPETILSLPSLVMAVGHESPDRATIFGLHGSVSPPPTALLLSPPRAIDIALAKAGTVQLLPRA